MSAEWGPSGESAPKPARCAHSRRAARSFPDERALLAAVCPIRCGAMPPGPPGLQRSPCDRVAHRGRGPWRDRLPARVALNAWQSRHSSSIDRLPDRMPRPRAEKPRGAWPSQAKIRPPGAAWRSADALKRPTYVEEKDSGELRRPHHLDPDRHVSRPADLEAQGRGLTPRRSAGCAGNGNVGQLPATDRFVRDHNMVAFLLQGVGCWTSSGPNDVGASWTITNGEH